MPIGARQDRRPVAEVGPLEAQGLEPLRRQPGASMRVVDGPWWRADPTLVVQHIAKEQRGFRCGMKTDAARRVPRAVHHGQAGDDVAIIEKPRLSGRRADDVAREPCRQSPGIVRRRRPRGRCGDG